MLFIVYHFRKKSSYLELFKRKRCSQPVLVRITEIKRIGIIDFNMHAKYFHLYGHRYVIVHLQLLPLHNLQTYSSWTSHVLTLADILTTRWVYNIEFSKVYQWNVSSKAFTLQRVFSLTNIKSRGLYINIYSFRHCKSNSPLNTLTS